MKMYIASVSGGYDEDRKLIGVFSDHVKAVIAANSADDAQISWLTSRGNRATKADIYTASVWEVEVDAVIPEDDRENWDQFPTAH